MTTKTTTTIIITIATKFVIYSKNKDSNKNKNKKVVLVIHTIHSWIASISIHTQKYVIFQFRYKKLETCTNKTTAESIYKKIKNKK